MISHKKKKTIHLPNPQIKLELQQYTEPEMAFPPQFTVCIFVALTTVCLGLPCLENEDAFAWYNPWEMVMNYRKHSADHRELGSTTVRILPESYPLGARLEKS